MKILVVDDHVLIRDALRSVLKEVKRDAAVLEASDCSQAMEQIAEHADIGLILLDLNLPDRDGFSVLAELRERYPGISVVVLSGRSLDGFLMVVDEIDDLAVSRRKASQALPDHRAAILAIHNDLGVVLEDHKGRHIIIQLHRRTTPECRERLGAGDRQRHVET